MSYTLIYIRTEIDTVALGFRSLQLSLSKSFSGSMTFHDFRLHFFLKLTMGGLSQKQTWQLGLQTGLDGGLLGPWL